MERYSAGTEAEAIDSFGVWHCCTVRSAHEEGINVHFNGWSSKWDKKITENALKYALEVE